MSLENNEIQGQQIQTAAKEPLLLRSLSIGAVTQALADAQKGFKPIIKKTVNPFYNKKYADLAEVIECTQESLAANGLAVIQLPTFEDGQAKLTTLLSHSSGEYIGSILAVPGEQKNPQTLGIAITYGRRYAYQAIVGVAAEDDTDGSEPAKTNVQPSPKPQPKVNQVPAQPKNDPRPQEPKQPPEVQNTQPKPVQKTDDLPTKDELKVIQTDVREWAKKVDKDQLIAFIRKTANQEDSKLITKTQWNTIFGMLKQAEGVSIDKLKEIVGGKSE